MKAMYHVRQNDVSVGGLAEMWDTRVVGLVEQAEQEEQLNLMESI